MKLSANEMAALCEYVDGRRAAGATYEVIAGELAAYTVAKKGEEPRLTEEDLDGLEGWHRQWSQRQAYLQRQRASGDVRAGSKVAEVAVDWQEVDEGKMRLDGATSATDPALFERAETLRAVMYLKRGLLRARWKWVLFRNVGLPEGVECEECRGPGRCLMADGREAEWLVRAVIFRRKKDGAVTEVFEECRVRRERPVGWKGSRAVRMDLERRELDGEQIDIRDVSARLAALLHTCLGGARSPFRNNQHLAQLLGVTREAMRVRRLRIMQDAGLRSAEGLVPARANGGRAAQERKSRSAAGPAEGNAS